MALAKNACPAALCVARIRCGPLRSLAETAVRAMSASRSSAVRAQPPRIAITHDYLVQYGGAEKVLEAIHKLWPDAPIYTTFYDKQRMTQLGFRIPPRVVRPLLPKAVPHAGRIGKAWTFVYPALWRALSLGRYDLVISSSSFAAHHIRVRAGAKHICYCHTPPRFLYGLTTELDHERLSQMLPGLGLAYGALRKLDSRAARSVTKFVANSNEVRTRIERVYRRESVVIHPPVETSIFQPARIELPGEYFLSYGRLVGSKRVDLVIDAANSTGMALVIAGSGPEEQRLRARAGPTVRFVGRPTTPELVQLIGRSKAVIFSAEEDFGIVPVETMAAGKPVIALQRGGATETVIPGVTGEFFADQEVEALEAALRSFDGARYTPEACRNQAAKFDEKVFAARFSEYVAQTLGEHHCI
jgi:glycosyltransferase involved in cell wall biosynthesis